MNELLQNKEWRNERGQLHQVYGPAIEWADGDKAWYFNGLLLFILTKDGQFLDGNGNPVNLIIVFEERDE